MANNTNKKKSTVKKNQQVQKIKMKSELTSTLSVLIPLVGVFVFLFGGFALFVFLEEGRRIPDERYLAAQQLVKDGTLIGLTLEESTEAVGHVAFVEEDEGTWIFMAGQRALKNGEGARFYQIYIEQENGRAISAVLREQEWGTI